MTMEIPPITSVDTDGVRNFWFIFANGFGSAPYTLIDKLVRAVGRMVVWVEAAAELSTMRISRCERNVPSQDVPNTAVPSTEMTSVTWLGLARPIPVAP